MKRFFLMGIIASGWSSGGSANGLPDLKAIVASVDGEYLSYSGDFGRRVVVNAQTRIGTGPTKYSFLLSHGTRKAGDEKFEATRVQASLVHDWSARISTRTVAGFGSDEPIFVNRELGQEISYKPLAQTVVTAGGRYARYFNSVDSWSWSLGAAQYFKGGYVSYRFSDYDTDGLGHSVGHLVSGKLEDPYGATQLWLGHGTALHDADFLAVPQKGKYTQVEVQRSQSLGAGISLNVGVRRNWHETPSAKVHGTGVRVGFTLKQ